MTGDEVILFVILAKRPLLAISLIMISLLPYRVKLESLYSELQQVTEEYRSDERNKNKDYVLFGALCGENYERGGLMILGRSTDGWYRYVPSNISPFEGEKPIIDYPKQLTILKQDNTNSRLWQVLNALCPRLIGDNWEQKIVYSNYCKISPDEDSEENGTPPKKLRNLQESICNKILKIEIESFQPRHIIVFTGCNIEDIDFSERAIPALHEICSKEDDFKMTSWPPKIDECSWGCRSKFGIEVYKMGDTFIYLTEHPDRKEVQSHAKALYSMITKFVGEELKKNCISL